MRSKKQLRKRLRLIFTVVVVQMTTFYTMWSFVHISSDRSLLEKTNLDIPHNISTSPHRMGYSKVQKCHLSKRKNVDCEGLFRGDPISLQKAKIQNLTNFPEECRLENLVKNCGLFIQAHGYMNRRITQEEKMFPLAFTIRMHRSPQQAEQLLRTIYRPHNVYCIYVDFKSTAAIYDLMTFLGKCFSNVFVVEEREPVIYSSIDLVKVELVCMRKLVDSNIRWKYYINLTGQEFPLRTNLEIVKILKSLNGANDVESYNFPKSLEKRFKTVHIPKGGTHLIATNSSKSPFPYKVDMRKGSAYGLFRYEFIQFLLNDDIALDFITWLYESYAPEESVFATLNTLPWAPGGYSMEVRHDREEFLSRAMLWQWDKVKCKGPYLRSVCVFGAEDLQWLIGRPEIIANKFESEKDSTSIDCMEELLRNRTKTPHMNHFNWYYYNNLPHSRHYRSKNKSATSEEFLSQQKSIWMKEKKINKV